MSSIYRDRTKMRAPVRAASGHHSCDNFLDGLKGAPSARHAYGRDRLRDQARATEGE